MSPSSPEQIVTHTVHAAQAVFGQDIEAIYTLGSLAHGGFAPLVSDIDVAIILTRTRAATRDQIARVQTLVSEATTGRLAQRLSLFWADWTVVQTGQGDDHRLGPVDRLDLLDSGQLIVGRDEREPGLRPSGRELTVMSADHILRRYSDAYLEQLRDTAAIVAGGPRLVTKEILFPVRFMYTAATGGIGLNEESARWYAEEGRAGGPLALQALAWRQMGITDPDSARELLDADLATLCSECFSTYAQELEAIGEGERAAAMAERVGRMNVSPNAR